MRKFVQATAAMRTTSAGGVKAQRDFRKARWEWLRRVSVAEVVEMVEVEEVVVELTQAHQIVELLDRPPGEHPIGGAVHLDVCVK